MMKNKEAYENICFQIISAAGTAKSCYLEAIEYAKQKEPYEEALKEGRKAFCQASSAHQDALQMDAEGNLDVGLLLIHAESILGGAEIIGDLAETIIALLHQS
ncbi:MAG: PTS lactose/cellobiose transporter subunit IIA [Lachnospiraceae bacterium]|nr:PTS lactose/cellobiose transporter subunit IIA [Lachnospiraceae bacterium]